jgi:hypothetical protein
VHLQTTREPLEAWEHIIREVNFLSGIAKAKGSLASLKDLVALTRTNLSEAQLESSWAAIPELACSYELKNGLIIERKNDLAGYGPTSVDQELEKRARAKSYAQYAREFASLFNGRETKLIAISGSTSYQSPSEADDLDIFCITRPDYLWLFLTKSLLIARFLHIFKRNAPRICFSYAVDRNFAENKFLFSRDALFARDALTTVVIHGQEYYRELLKKSSWISKFFPSLYQSRTSIMAQEVVAMEQVASPPSRKFLNLLLLFLAGNYIRAKSSILNRKLRRHGQIRSFFTVKIGKDHCVFESAGYVTLQDMYRQFAATNPAYQFSVAGKEADHH